MTESTPSDAPVESNSSVNITHSQVQAHDIIGGDKIIRGDEIHGDKYIGYSAEQVNLLLTQIQSEYRPRPFDGRSPYIGLRSFQKDDADRFFGRENLIKDLVARVMQCAASNARAVFVAGPSGSGKSSLVRAGLLPALRKNSDSEYWLCETIEPGREPLAELKDVITSFTNKLDMGEDFFTHANDRTSLHAWVKIALKEEPTRRAVIVIDQFEEIFTQLTLEQEAKRAAFLNLLTYAATVENGRTVVVFTLRSDFVTNCASYPELNALVNQQFLQVGAMSPDELVSAIARPALQVGLRLDPALIAQVVNDVRGEPGALPLMQFALQDLFEHEKHKGELTLDGYLERGGLHEALERHADAEFAKLDDVEKELARSVFGGLIEIGRGREDTKRTARFGELVPAGADAARVQALVQELADARLITTGEQDGKETVTLAHERLIDAWSWLRKLVDENRDAIALQNEIKQDAQEWETQKRDESYLYYGARLATAQEKLQQKQLTLSGLAQEFIDTAIQARERERAEREAARQKELEQARALAEVQQKRAEEQQAANKVLRQRNLFLAGAFVLAVSAVIAALFFLIQSNANLQIARSRELAALASSKFNTSPELAALIAIEANKPPQSRTFESEDALREILYQYPLNAVLLGYRQSVHTAHFSPNGTRVVTASDEDTARLWDTQTGKSVVLVGHENAVVNARFSHDGKRVVTASYDGTARVWDAVNGNKLAILPAHQGLVLDVQFSPDDEWILTIGCDKLDENLGCLGSARLWDVASLIATGTAKELAIIRGNRAISSAQFSPNGWQNGLQIITTDCDKPDYSVMGVDSPCFAHTAHVWSVGATSDKAEIREIGNIHVDDGWVIQTQFVSTDSVQSVWVVTTDTNGQLRVLDAISGKQISDLKQIESDVALAEISPDGTKMVTLSADLQNIALIWNLEDGNELGWLGHEYQVNIAHFSPDGSKIITASADEQTAKIWEASRLYAGLNTNPLAVLRIEDYVTSVEFSPDGTQIATTGMGGTAKLWDSNGGKEFAALRGQTSRVTSAEYSPDGALIVTAGCDKADNGNVCRAYSARVWEVKSGKQLALLHADGYAVQSAQFLPARSQNKATILTLGCEELEGISCVHSKARLWDAANGAPLAILGTQENIVLTAVFSPDGKWIATIECAHTDNLRCISGVVRIWDVSQLVESSSIKEVAVLHDFAGLATANFSSDSTQFVLAGCAQVTEKSTCAIGKAWMWNISNLVSAKSGSESVAFVGHTDWVLSAQFQPSGSSNSKRLVTGSRDGTARIWDTVSGKEVGLLRGENTGAIRAQFSPDGTRILTVNSGLLDKTVRIWDAVNYNQITVLQIPASNFTSAEFSPDQSKIVTISMDPSRAVTYSARVWDANSGAAVSTLRGSGSQVNTAHFSPDGKQILTASDDGVALIHLVNVSDLVELAQTRIGRELTCAERVEYLRAETVCPTPTPEVTPTP